MSMQDQRDRFDCVAVDQQNDHLAIALVRSMMWTGTIRDPQFRVMKIKGLHDTKTD